MSLCERCGCGENVDEHHVSYSHDVTVPLCRSCHQKVHGNKDSPYHPIDTPPKSTICISEQNKHLLDQHKKDGESYNDAVGRLLGNPKGQLWTEDEIKELIKEYGYPGSNSVQHTP